MSNRFCDLSVRPSLSLVTSIVSPFRDINQVDYVFPGSSNVLPISKRKTLKPDFRTCALNKALEFTDYLEQYARDCKLVPEGVDIFPDFEIFEKMPIKLEFLMFLPEVSCKETLIDILETKKEQLHNGLLISLFILASALHLGFDGRAPRHLTWIDVSV